MFRLYFNYNGWQKTERNFSYTKKDGEYDFTLRFYAIERLVQTMQYIANKYHIYYFMVIENVYDCDNIITVTRSEEDYNEFLLHYNDSKVNYEDLSCVELKKLILERPRNN